MTFSRAVTTVVQFLYRVILHPRTGTGNGSSVPMDLRGFSGEAGKVFVAPRIKVTVLNPPRPFAGKKESNGGREGG